MATELLPLVDRARAAPRPPAPGGSGAPTRSLKPLLAPRSVAVTGAMQRHGHPAYEVVRSLRDYGFRGRLYPVHDAGRPVCGIPAYRAVADLPEPADLIVVADNDQAAAAIRAAGRRGIADAVVLGAAGPREGSRLRRVADEYGVRLIGPGSVGVLNTDPGVRLDATLSRTRPARGGLALASQSSAVGVALLEHVSRNGCGVASFVSAGDDADLGRAELIDYWLRDARTRAVALFPDRLEDLRRLPWDTHVLARRKPVLVIGGATPEAIVAGSPLGQAGIVLTGSLDEMTDAARVLVNQPLPAGERLGVVGNAGALTTITAATARAYGFAPPSGPADQPVDLGATAGPAEFAAAVETMATGGGIDLVIVVVVGTKANCPAAVLTALAEVLDHHPELTAAAVLTGSPDDIHRIGVHDTPVFRQQDRAIRALAHARRYATWRRGRAGFPAGRP